MILQATIDLERCLTMAAQVGCYPDQMERFTRAGYFSLPRGLEFHAAAREVDNLVDTETPIVGYGGPRGEAKSHAVIAQVGLDDCQRLEGAKWLYLRKIQKSAGEQLDDLISKVFGGIAHDYKPSRGVVKFPNNGSRIIIGGYRSENEIDGYIGIEYDGIVLEDATTLSKGKIDKIRGSCRSSKPGWQPRLYAPANPGGVGHQWYKKLLFDPWKQGREKDTRFIHARPGDNPFINPSYRKYLDGLTGWLRRAWRDGDFSIAAGQIFTTFDPEIHVIEPIPIDQHQLWWGTMDYGTVHWNTTHLLARVGQNYFVVDEHAARRQLAKENANGIKAMLSRNGIGLEYLRTFVAGHDVFAERGTKNTIADEYAENGIILSRARVDRINGANRILELLGNPKPESGQERIEPRLFIFNRCHKLIETLPEMQHDPNRAEDVLKVDCNPDTGEGGDDAYDDLRYGLMEDLGDYGIGENPMTGYRG